LTGTAEALAAGEFSPAHAQVLAAGIHHLPAQGAAEAEPVLDTARRLDPPRLRRVVTHLRGVLDPESADALTDRQQLQRRLWLSPTLDGMVAVEGLLDPEAGQSSLAALEPLARPASAADERSAAQRRADALAELARRSLEGGRLPQTGGVRPQLIVTVDLDSLVGRHGTFGGEIGGVGPPDPEACRRLACDGALTRVLVTRHLTHHHGDPDHHPTGHPDHHPGHGPTNHSGPGHPDQYGHPDQPRQDAPGPGDGLGGHDHPHWREWGWRAGRPAAGGGDPAAPRPWWGAQPAVGGRPRQPGGQRRPTHGPGGPRRRLRGHRLRPAPGLVRGPPSAPLAARRRHRPGEPGVGVPGPSSGGA
jgi:Domain of unknown function (DUF222)